MRGWNERHRHSCFWGEAGKSSTGSAFDTLIHNEIASHRGAHFLVCLLDLWKCYEMVDHTCLLKAAKETGASQELVYMAACLYRLPRRLRMFDSFSYELRTKQGIIAGCSLAKDLLKVLMWDTIMRTAAAHPLVRTMGFRRRCQSTMDRATSTTSRPSGRRSHLGPFAGPAA